MKEYKDSIEPLVQFLNSEFPDAKELVTVIRTYLEDDTAEEQSIFKREFLREKGYTDLDMFTDEEIDSLFTSFTGFLEEEQSGKLTR